MANIPTRTVRVRDFTKAENCDAIQLCTKPFTSTKQPSLKERDYVNYIDPTNGDTCTLTLQLGDVRRMELMPTVLRAPKENTTYQNEESKGPPAWGMPVMLNDPEEIAGAEALFHRTIQISKDVCGVQPRPNKKDVETYKRWLFLPDEDQSKPDAKTNHMVYVNMNPDGARCKVRLATELVETTDDKGVTTLRPSPMTPIQPSQIEAGSRVMVVQRMSHWDYKDRAGPIHYTNIVVVFPPAERSSTLLLDDGIVLDLDAEDRAADAAAAAAAGDDVQASPKRRRLPQHEDAGDAAASANDACGDEGHDLLSDEALLAAAGMADEASSALNKFED